MPLPRVDIFWSGHEQRLVRGEHDIVVPEGVVGLRVSASRRFPVSFDDEPLALVWSVSDDTAYAQVDLTNRVGFHRVSIRSELEAVDFDFQTSSTKAPQQDIKEMANFVIRHVFTFRHQFHYTLPDGTRRTVALPQMEFGWLRDRIPEICTLVGNVARRPGTQFRNRVVTSFQGRHVAVAQTLSHLRENPHFLEPGEGGPFIVNQVSYWPASVRVSTPVREVARREHEQIAYFLRLLAMALLRLRGEAPSLPEEVLEELESQLASVRHHSVIQRYDAPRLRSPWSPMPTIIQRTDDHYGRLRALQAEYMMNIAPTESGYDAVRANVRDVWEIYQAFCAHVVGYALGLHYVSKRCDLRDRDSSGRSMIGGSIELYYDMRPPSDILPSWRDLTARPSAERPDIVLVDRSTKQAVLLDVKFRNDRSGKEANVADLHEMQSYMHSYGLAAGGIVFPGRGDTQILSAIKRMLVALPLLPTAEHGALLKRVRDTVNAMWTMQTFQ